MNIGTNFANKKLLPIFLGVLASPDFDRSDRMYIEELSFERVFDIVTLENPKGIFCSVGGMGRL